MIMPYDSARAGDTSSPVLREQSALGTIWRRAEVSSAFVAAAVMRHRQLLIAPEGPDVLKLAAKTRVTQMSLTGESAPRRVCVKEFVRPRSLRLLPAAIRHRPAVQSWRAAEALERLGIGAPRALAMVLGKGCESFFIMEACDAEIAGAYVQRHAGAFSRARRNAFTRAAAEFLCRCHRQGVFHQDMKSSNLFIREAAPEGWQFLLLDHAAIRLVSRVRPEEKRLNLAQLNASTPLQLTWTDRLRFMRRMAELDPALAGRATLRAVAALTRARRCVWLRK